MKDVKYPAAAFTIATNPHLKKESDDLKDQNIHLHNVNEQLLQEIKELCARNSVSEGQVEILEQKVKNAEASALKSFNKNSEEIVILKNSLKKYEIDLENANKDVQLKNKTIKLKDKEILKLDQKCDNLSDALKKVKGDFNVLKVANKKLEKQKTVPNMKSVMTNMTQTNFPSSCLPTSDSSIIPSNPFSASVEFTPSSIYSLSTSDSLDESSSTFPSNPLSKDVINPSNLLNNNTLTNSMDATDLLTSRSNSAFNSEERKQYEPDVTEAETFLTEERVHNIIENAMKKQRLDLNLFRQIKD